MSLVQPSGPQTGAAGHVGDHTEMDISDEHVLVIEHGRAERHYWRDLWRYRELFQVLAWRDVAVRYKQTVIGVAWALIRPFLTMVIFTVIFGKLAGLPSDGGAGKFDFKKKLGLRGGQQRGARVSGCDFDIPQYTDHVARTFHLA